MNLNIKKKLDFTWASKSTASYSSHTNVNIWAHPCRICSVLCVSIHNKWQGFNHTLFFYHCCYAAWFGSCCMWWTTVFFTGQKNRPVAGSCSGCRTAHAEQKKNAWEGALPVDCGGEYRCPFGLPGPGPVTSRPCLTWPYFLTGRAGSGHGRQRPTQGDSGGDRGGALRVRNGLLFHTPLFNTLRFLPRHARYVWPWCPDVLWLWSSRFPCWLIAAL